MQEVSLQAKDYLKDILCSYNKPCQLLCFSPNCTKNACVCKTQNCQCFYSDHIDCQFVTSSKIFNLLKQKSQYKMKSQTQKIFNQIDSLFLNTIEELSKFRQKYLSWRELYGYNQAQIKMIEALKINDKNAITGNLINEIKKQLLISDEEVLKKVKIKIVLESQKIHKMLEKLKVEQNKLVNVKHFPVKVVNKQLLSKGEIQSAITSQFGLISSFFNQPVQSFRLLYRASINNFKIKQFYQNCQGIPNTLTLIQTEFGKKIGGYTPIPWKNEENKKKLIPDYQRKSFLFSITNKQKYQLVMAQCGVVHYAGFNGGPAFGCSNGSDIYISNAGKYKKQHNFNFPNAYNNGQQKNQQSRQRFSGIKDGTQCAIKEWEVFQVIYKK